MAKNITDEDLVKFSKRTLETLKAERLEVEPEVDNVIRFVNHQRRSVEYNREKDRSRKGQRTGRSVYDGTAISAAQIAADGIYGYLCSQSLRWFEFNLPGIINFPRTSGLRAFNDKPLDSILQVRQWLDNCEEVMYSAYARSNFYNFCPTYIYEGVSIGTTTAMIEEDVGKGRINFIMPHFRECFIAQDQFGRVDTLYRLYQLEMRQLVQKFGEEFLEMKPEFKQQYENDPYQEKLVLHATYPRADYDPAILNGKNKKIGSFWILMEEGGAKNGGLIEESGFDSLPNVTWRWFVNSDEKYGRSPAWFAMVDIMKANQQGKTNLEAGHKMVKPPMFASTDLRGKIHDGPGGQTFGDGDAPKSILTNSIQLPFGIDQQERTDRAIREHFHTDFFTILNNAAANKTELTATQALGMQAEQAVIIAARIGRFQTEGLNEIMDRVWNIEFRARRLPDPPPILQDMGVGLPIETDYRGPLAQAQKAAFKIQGIRGGIQGLSEIGQIYPDATDKVDFDILVEEYMDSVNFPTRALRSDDQVAFIRKNRRIQEAAKLAMDNLEQGSKATKNLSKTVEPDSVLNALVEGVQQ
jgi:hypothetical protein